MEAPEFKDFAKEMVEYIANYLENIRDRWESIKKKKIMCGARMREANASGHCTLPEVVLHGHRTIRDVIWIWI